MALILNIETSTIVCSVALSKDGKLIAFRESKEKNSHSEVITLFIEKIFKKANLNYSSIDAIAVSKGPGSYTGLRIGVSTTKGLCYALDKPLIAISTLQSMAYAISMKYIAENTHRKDDILFCPMIDARRMEVYSAIFDINNNIVRNIEAEIINDNSFTEYLKKGKIVFFGDGADKCITVLSQDKNAVFIKNVYPSACNMISLSENKFIKGQFEDIAYFEPFYLKDFIAGKPKVKGLF
ncbi:MAG: tRNA (adenosine(37)-N6)-threonylcarbamoyltransferase complex dimerization subunit type 1 TsaB [Bacteroidales bacterium]|nr:tRNA (adenosine(37)-N6)-threonylcarbamoyltransferase complex dimerization subunit type 1 TsaB [Bacteroidales bacterium]